MTAGGGFTHPGGRDAGQAHDPAPAGVADGFPRRFARTRGFTLGRPRSVTVAADGRRVAFLRTRSGDDPRLCLWVLDDDSPAPRLVADPAAAGDGGGEDLPPAERARRERTRERAGGIVAYAGDQDLNRVVFALAGRLLVAELGATADGSAAVRELPTAGPADDPRLDPTGTTVAYVSAGSLHVTPVAQGTGQVAGQARGQATAPLLAAVPEQGVTWGLAEFIAAEEMGRTRGYWWAPDGRRLAVARVDERPVRRWHLADPADPARPPVTLPYPAAGTRNADVGLVVADLDGRTVEIVWDRAALPYLVAVRWDQGAPLTLLVQSRDQRRTEVLTADPGTGATALARRTDDPTWVELVQGTPRWLPDGRLVTTVDDGETRRLALDGIPVTPPGLQVRSVVHAGHDGVVFTGGSEPTEVHVWHLDARPDGPATGAAPEPARLTTLPGMHSAVAAGGTVVIASAGLDGEPDVEVRRPGRPAVTLPSIAEQPAVLPRPLFLRAGERALRSALLLPRGHHGERLPVLLDPYGGPHSQRVVKVRDAFLTSQWFADQGFAVVVTDGRGTPGRGPIWERAIHMDLAGPVLDDQVEALHAIAADHPELDLGRVAIRGWSFGGFLAALAVLRRPDVFHAAVAGAPVTDWRLYDTHYTERYLGDPNGPAAGQDGLDGGAVYERSSLLADAPRLTRPLLLIHGLADDNVVAAHTLRLSSALLAAGRPHTVLPLSGVTHMTPQEVVAENLLRLQLAFIREALGLPGAG
jgi:dipeptidyl-peptidase 4